MSLIRDEDHKIIYCGDKEISVNDFLLIAKYIETEVLLDIEQKKVVIVMPDGLTQACYLLYCLQKYEVLPLTDKYLSHEYEDVLKSFAPDIVIGLTNSTNTEIKAACLATELRLLNVDKIDNILNNIKLKYKDSVLDQSLLDLNQGKLILFTSGTTGKPKQVAQSWTNIQASIHNISNSYNLGSNDVCLNIMPLYHIHGIIVCFLTSIYSGGQVVILDDGFDVIKFFASLEKYKISWYSGVPTMHQSIIARIRSKYDGIVSHNLRFIRSSSSALPVKVRQDLSEIFKVPIYQAYGLTEACHITSQAINKDSSINSAGFAVNVDIEIRDDNGARLSLNKNGNIWIKGKNLFSNYINLSKKESGFSADGYFNTGDIGFLDNDGALVIVSRTKEMINKSGEKIAPHEIEDIILMHPLVENAVCFSVEDKYCGEDIGLAIVLKKNMQCSAVSIKEYLTDFVNDFKMPRDIYFLNELPKGRTGKLQRIGLEKVLKNSIKLANNKFKPKVEITNLNLSAVNPNDSINPSSELEKIICEYYANILDLNIEKINGNDNFFELGGNSLLALRLIFKLGTRFTVHLNDIFKYKTPAKLAQMLPVKHTPLSDRLAQIKSAYSKQTFNKNLDYKVEESVLYQQQFYTKTISSVFLTGATGYLGCHLLYELLSTTKHILYLPIRSNSTEHSFTRLHQKFKYYFNQDLNIYKNRINVFSADISKEHFGVSKSLYDQLALKVNSIIHCAALVKFYGDDEEFYQQNVKSTVNLLEFAKLTQDKDFHYISTIWVFPNSSLSKGGSNIFTEDSIIDDYTSMSSIYTKTKYLGEQEILKYRTYGINANIYRVGNLAINSTTYKLQENIESNGFFQRVKTILQLGIISKELSETNFSPVDSTAKAISLLFNKVNLPNQLYHVFNPNRINLYKLLNASSQINIKQVTIAEFIDFISEQLNNNVNSQQIELFMLLQSWLQPNINNLAKPIILQNKTNHILSSLLFSWPVISPEMLLPFITKVNP
jgi:thioester reductase-like protein